MGDRNSIGTEPTRRNLYLDDTGSGYTSGDMRLGVDVEATDLHSIVIRLDNGTVGTPAPPLPAFGSEQQRDQNATVPLRDYFAVLAKWWHADTEFQSSLARIIESNPYRLMLDRGEQIVPYIIDAMRDSNDQWDLVLEDILGIQPPIPDGYGEDPEGIREAWLNWWNERGESSDG